MGDEKVLTVVEGRVENKNMVLGLKRAAHAKGLRFRQVHSISVDDFAKRKNFDKIFSDFVVWRNLTQSNVEKQDLTGIYLKKRGAIAVNCAPVGGESFTSDKYFMYQLFDMDEILRDHNLPMWEAFPGKAYLKRLAASKQLAYPFLLKERYGTAGGNIYCIRKASDIDNLSINIANYGAQPFVEIECEWRVFVMGGVPICIMKKNAGEFDKTNFKRMSGGVNKTFEDNETVREIVGALATRAAVVSGLEYTGVDIVREQGTGKYYVLETNFAAGWQNGVLEATGVDVPMLMVDWFLDMDYDRHHNRGRSMKNYVERRLEFLNRKDRQTYAKILNFESDISVAESKYDLFSRIFKAYNMVRSGKAGRADFSDIISEVEQLELSRYGVFFDYGDGSLSEALTPTAAFIAIATSKK